MRWNCRKGGKEVERSYKEVAFVFNMNGVVKELQQQVSWKASLASSVFTQRPPHTCLHAAAHLLKAICLSFAFPPASYARLPLRNLSP